MSEDSNQSVNSFFISSIVEKTKHVLRFTQHHFQLKLIFLLKAPQHWHSRALNIFEMGF